MTIPEAEAALTAAWTAHTAAEEAQRAALDAVFRARIAVHKAKTTLQTLRWEAWVEEQKAATPLNALAQINTPHQTFTITTLLGRTPAGSLHLRHLVRAFAGHQEERAETVRNRGTDYRRWCGRLGVLP